MASIFGLLKELEELTNDDEAPEVLTAERISQLYYIPTRNLEIIYKHGKRKVRIDNTDEAYAQLYYLSRSQLEAIFGSDTH